MKLGVFFLCYTALLLANDYPPPILKEPTEVSQDVTLPKDESPSLARYRRAQMLIETKQFQAAEQVLKESVADDPDQVEVRLQLGFVLLWQNKLEQARQIFASILKEYPCEPTAAKGMSEIARKWEDVPKKRGEALAIYAQLHDCFPKDAFYPYRMGRIYGIEKQWAKAEQTLHEAIALSPDDSDIHKQLGLTYFWQHKYEQADAVFMQFPDDSFAQDRLAKSALIRRKFSQAEYWFARSLESDPDNLIAMRNLAYAQFEGRSFRKSRDTYRQLLEKDPKNRQVSRSLFDAELYTTPSLDTGGFFTAVREADPFEETSVVDYYYINAFGKLLIPVNDTFRFGIRPSYGRQYERNLLNETINYDARFREGEIDGEFTYNQYLTLRCFMRLKEGKQGRATTNLPFSQTTSFEPGGSVQLTNGPGKITVNSYFDSYLVKNFARGQTTLQVRNNILGVAQYRYDGLFQPSLGALARNSYYQDSINNKMISREAWCRFKFLGWADVFSFAYRLRYQAFTQVSPNYYSYKRQNNNRVSLAFNKTWNSLTSFSLVYYFEWERTIDQNAPISLTPVLIPDQKITAFTFEAVFNQQIKERVRLNIIGYYYRSTFPVRVVSIKGNLVWLF